MAFFTEDTVCLFDEVQHEINNNIRNMMTELWQNWCHLGVEESVKVKNIRKLVQIEKEHYDDVMSETRQRIHNMEIEIKKLKQETRELSESLSINISIVECKDGTTLTDYKKELEDHIAEYREQVKQRRLKVDRLMEWQKDLVEKLGVSMLELKETPLPSEEDVNKLEEQMEILQAERDKRVEVFLNAQIEIKDIMDQLQLKPSNKFEHAVVTSLSVEFKVTDFNMDRLNKLRQDLQEKYEQTNNRVLELRERLTKLWDCLEEDVIYQENFLQAHRGCTPATETAIREELKRCEQIKRQKIQVFVANVRTKIKLMWDNLMFSKEERDFVHYYRDFFNEDSLTLHELYLEQLTKQYNDNKHIYELINTRNNLWSKKIELEARANDPNRFHNRGGQLLKEEKERKAIDSNLPKIEAQLRDYAEEYEMKIGKAFTVDGKPLVQLMEDEWETHKTVRQNKVQSARKQALTPNAAVQLRRLAVSPLGKRNRTAAGFPATAEKTGPKRQLITASATKAASSIHANLSALKRSAITTVKRRVSGRLAARALHDNTNVKRKLDYGNGKQPTPKANGSILKYKRVSHGKRRSAGHASMSKTQSTASSQEDEPHNNPLMETTQSTYTDFKEFINKDKTTRSSLVNKMENVPTIHVTHFQTLTEQTTPKNTPKKAPRFFETPTSKYGKENIRSAMTPKANYNTPNARITRSSLKNNDGFATPRAPFSANKIEMQNGISIKTTPNLIRTNTRGKNY